MKQFYTVRDIEDMHAAGVVDIETHDDVVLTDVAREKAIALGMRLVPVETAADGRKGPGISRTALAQKAEPTPRAGTGSASVDLADKIKTAVIARLGTDKYNDLLDKIIPQVMSQMNK
jgi:hypothetical protein